MRWIFARFIEIGSGTELTSRGIQTSRGNRIDKKYLYRLLNNRTYIGEAVHKCDSYPGEHDAIIDRAIWDKVHAILTESPRKRAARIPAPGALGLGASIVLCGALPSTLLPQSPSSIQQTHQIPVSLTFGLLNISDELKAVRPRAGAAQPTMGPDSRIQHFAEVSELNRIVRIENFTTARLYPDQSTGSILSRIPQVNC